MADVPRDPRQLARDILSGKVKIEDLQRERQMRAGGAPQVPAKIPLPRPVQQPAQRPIPQQRPAPLQRPAALPRPAARPVPQRGPVIVRQPQRPVTVPAARMPAPARAAMPPVPVQQPKSAQPMTAYDLPTVLSSQAQVSAGAKKELRLHQLMRSSRAVRQGIMMAEILGKPLSLRDQ